MQNNTFLDFDPINTFFFPESHSRMHNEHTKPFPKVASKKTHVRLSPPFYQTLSARCVRTVRVHTYNVPKHHTFISFIHLWAGMQFGILVIHSQRERERGERKERQRKHLYDRIGTHTVSSNLGTPLPPSPAPSVCMCVWVPVSMHVCELPPRPPPPPCLSRLLHAALRRLEKVVVVSLKYHFNYGV